MASATEAPAPKRGGKMYLGVYVGGCGLNMEYKLVSNMSYCSTFQVRTPKATATAEKTLYDSKLNTSQIKFNGNLELPAGSISGAKELDKMDFIRSLDTTVSRFGLESFFHLPLTGEMKYLIDDSHHFTIQDVMDEHSSRLATTGTFKEYDDYERFDIYLSRLAVEALISSALEGKIRIRYGHYDNFKRLPGQVYFMMILDICNSSADHDIEAATLLFGKLALADYPGENIESFTSEALRLIKIMQGAYALPYTLSSDLLNKVTSTSSEFFNRTVFTYLDKVSAMEDKVGASRDPKLITKDPLYKTHGPVALCSKLQQEYARFFKRPGGWPALSGKIPQANYVKPLEPTDATRDDQPTDRGGPPTGPPRTIPGDANQPLGPPGWRFKTPADENHQQVLRGMTFMWCKYCVCRRSHNVGMYTKTHSTSGHKGPKPDATPVPAPPAASLPAPVVPAPPAPPVIAPKANLSPVLTGTSDDAHVDSDPNGLFFNEQAYCAELLSDEDGIWMASTPDPDDIDLSPPAAPTAEPVLPDASAPAPDIRAPSLEMMWYASLAAPNDPPSSDPPSSEESLDTPRFGRCMHCNATGYVYSACNECDDIFHPIEDTSSHHDSTSSVQSTVVEEEETDNSSATQVALNSQNLVAAAFDINNNDNYNPSTSSYLPTYFEYFDAHDTLPPRDPLAHYFEPMPSPSDSPSLTSSTDEDVDDDDYLYPDFSDSTLDDAETPSPTDDHADDDASIEDDDTYFDALDTLPTDQPTIIDMCFDYILFVLLLLNQGIASFYCAATNTLTGILRAIVFTPTLLSRLTLFSAAISWDTIILFRHPPSVAPTGTQTRRFKRHMDRHRYIPLVGYPRKWLVLTGCLALNGTLGMTHPSTVISSQIRHTYHNMSRLQLLVDLNFTTINQYHHLRYIEFTTGSSPNFDDETTFLSPLPPYCEPSSPLEENIIDLHDSEELRFLDANEELQDPDVPTQSFMDSFETVDDLDAHSLACDYYPCHEPPLPPISTPFNDMADLSNICAAVHHVSGDDTPADYDPCFSHLPSPAAYNSATHLLGSVYLKPRSTSLHRHFPVIFDSGASLAISPCKDDFVGPIQRLPTERRLGGMAAGMLIEGVGTVRWTFQADGKFLVVNSRCYYVPDSKARLISPQRLFSKQKGITGKFIVEEHKSTLAFDGMPPLTINFDSSSHLPIALAKNHSQLGTPIQANLAILTEENQNLTPSQKLLLEWHYRFGHKAMPAIQRFFRNAPFAGDRFKAAARCECPKCATCEFAKGHRRPTKGNAQSTNPHSDGSLRADAMRAGQAISVDHFESRLLGRTLTSYGKSASQHQYKGGCVFVDHMSSYIHVEHQLGFSSSETIRAKQNFEKLALDHGVIIANYHADNGTFKANSFVSHIREHNQKISYCGVNAHHKNAVAERSIRTVSECARALLLHAALHWKSGIDSSLWPLAVSYAAYTYNHLPNAQGIAPADLFTGVQIPRHKLQSFHTWGCPVYVLDPKLQQGKKLPRWEPRARRGIFVGYSSVHSSDVPLVLNIHTGHISPQYHVVFDDLFSTVPSLAADDVPPDFWSAIDFSSDLHKEHVYRIHLDKESPIRFDREFMTPTELEERQRLDDRATKIRSTFDSSPTDTAPTGDPTSTDSSESVPTASSSVATPKVTFAPSPQNTPAASPGLRRSSRSTKGQWNSTRLSEEQASTRLSEEQANYTTDFVDKVFLSSSSSSNDSHADKLLAYEADLHTNLTTGEMHCQDPRAYAAKTKKKYDADNPSYQDAMSGDNALDYQKAMITEIRQLIVQNTWKAVDRSSISKMPNGTRRPILKGMWAFKLKRLPDGTPLKFKARYCVRGDMQKEGIDFFETYAPVVQWSTVRLLLTMVLSKNWVTKQVDYTNAFAQATLKEEVYIDSPKGFSRKDKADRVLKLIKSLYGLRQAPLTFFTKLKTGLEQRGFRASELDPCLFMKHNMMVVVYVDDTIIAGPDADKIEELIKDLGVADEEERETFMLRDEGSVGDFLGIRIEKLANDTFTLSQTGLIEKVIKASGMSDCNSAVTPSSTDPLGSDKLGEVCNESWAYAEIVGMLMFLATNSRPDIAYAVNQCARFTHNPKASHATAVKRIIRYLKGTRTKGMQLKPNGQLQVDCYVDADFAGLWSVEDDQDPISVKSRSGHLIFFMGCPFSWSSKLQTQIALSTMESEYIALSNAMRELIACREILKEIFTYVMHDTEKGKSINYHTISKTFGEIPPSIVHEDNEACLKFATTPKMSP